MTWRTVAVAVWKCRNDAPRYVARAPSTFGTAEAVLTRIQWPAYSVTQRKPA